MATTGLRLRHRATETALIDELAARFPRIGLDGLLTRRGRRARWSRPRVPMATRGIRWRLDDQWDQTWWPQGIDVRPGDTGVMVVSWFAQERKGVRRGARLTFLDLRGRVPRYHHVLLVAPTRQPDGSVTAEPVPVHAGGVAWSGDRLFVAASRGGLREFRTGDLLDASASESASARVRMRRGLGPSGAGPFGADAILPQHAELRAETAEGIERLRYSFVSLESSAGSPALVVGEYTAGSGTRRLARIPVDADGGPAVAAARSEIAEWHDARIDRMQGALVADGTWFVTSGGTSAREPGDLWVGSPERFIRLRHALVPGPEDLAVSPARGELWTLSEFPGHRRVYALALDRVLEAARAADA